VSFLRDHLLHYGLVSERDFDLFRLCNTVDEAVAEILGFYRNYQNSRWVGRLFVIRMTNRLTPAAVAKLNDDFADLLVSGKIEQRGALPEEENEPLILHLPRLVLAHNHRDYGRLRELINAINEAEIEK
jgi:hypothetical protein